jgi:hypothetical protein
MQGKSGGTRKNKIEQKEIKIQQDLNISYRKATRS